MAYPGGAPVTLVGGQSGGAGAGTAANPLIVTGGTSGGQSATATKTTVAASTSNVTLKAANANRLGLTVYYDGAAILYLLEGAGTASSTNFTTKLGAGYFTQYDAPVGFVGLVQGVWSAATGTANVTERTA